MRRYRRNADARERDLERAVSQGDAEAAAALVRSYLRTGKISTDQIRTLASLKAEPYLEISEEMGLEVEPLTSAVMKSTPRMLAFMNSLDTGEAPSLNSVDLMLSAVELALKFPGEFGGPKGVERAQSLARLMELVRGGSTLGMARVLWRMSEHNARRLRGRRFEHPGGRVSEWQQENREAASDHILHRMFLPASRVVVVFYAHEVADEQGMGYGRFDQWTTLAGGVINSVFDRFYKYATGESSGPPGAPLRRFRADLAHSLTARWNLPLVTTKRRRRR